MAFFRKTRRSRGLGSVVSTDRAAVPSGTRVYAFGDLHGRADLLRKLCTQIDISEEEKPIDHTIIVGLGDYVDRGPDTRTVLDMLAALQDGFEVTLIKGNHEDLLLRFLSDPSRIGQAWLEIGGWETLVSYGVECSPYLSSAGDLASARDQLAARIPAEHLGLLSTMTRSRIIGDYVFVHAGFRPGVAIADASERDTMWIREGFVDRDEPFEKVVVHGHTPTTEAFIGQHHINLDTGAYATGKLSCMVFEERARRILEVTA